MADKLTRYLTNIGEGAVNPKGNLGDSRHASRIFVDGALARVPRSKFLFHVYFELNNDALLQSSQFKEKYKKDLSFLVKSSTLPRFSFETTIHNQYNKKRIMYKNINYDPVQIKFHDDSIGIINSLFALYFSYYSPDRINPIESYAQGTIHSARRDAEGLNNFRYGLDKDFVVENFFKSITIYTMSRRRFNSYKLINPVIQSWDHGDVNYQENGGAVEATMNISYETVQYGMGTVKKGSNPIAFGEEFYDTVPSPLSILGGSTSSLFGAGGLFGQQAYDIALDPDLAKSIFGTNYSEDNLSELNALQKAALAINLYNSFSQINAKTITQEVINLAANPNQAPNSNSLYEGVLFPGNTATRNSTPATPNN